MPDGLRGKVISLAHYTADVLHGPPICESPPAPAAAAGPSSGKPAAAAGRRLRSAFGRLHGRRCRTAASGLRVSPLASFPPNRSAGQRRCRQHQGQRARFGHGGRRAGRGLLRLAGGDRKTKDAARGDSQVRSVRQGIVVCDNEGAGIDEYSTVKGVGAGKRERAGADLGQAAIGERAVAAKKVVVDRDGVALGVDDRAAGFDVRREL